MNNIERQEELEVTSVSRGVERYYKARDVNRERGRQWDDSVENDLIAKMVAAMVPAVLKHQKLCRAKMVSAQTQGTRLSGFEMPIVLSDPTSMAYITIRTVLGGPEAGGKKLRLASLIGLIANKELRWRELREAESARAKTAPPNRLAYLKKEVKAINPKSVVRWLNKLEDVVTTIWTNEQKLRVGLELLGLMAETCEQWVDVIKYLHTVKGKVRTVHILKPKYDVMAGVERDHMLRAEARPWLLPMVCPPRPWRYDAEKKAHTGGYLQTEYELIKRMADPHTAGAQAAIPEACLTALNTMQGTSWKINRGVLDVAQEVWDKGLEDLTPVAPPRVLPPPVSAAEWDTLTPVVRKSIMVKRKEIYDGNYKLAGTRDTTSRVLTVAEGCKEEEAIYFPHNLDFRGRAYPLPQDLHPQGRDMSRGLLTFAFPVVLGATGLRWLTYQAAATYGLDKETRDEQFAWVIQNLDNIADVARDPLGRGREFLAQAEETFQFLAAALELEAAFNWEGGPELYPSSLPISVDGSCNGLQHLSAMGLDPVGAHATNLTADPERQDIYQIVADKVNQQVRHDAAWVDATSRQEHQSDLASKWYAHVTRKTVKRGVMTTPYGVTPIGMRDQLIADGFTKVVAEANYMRDKMADAIGDTIVVGLRVMEWMQDNARICSSNGRPVTWRTPSGFVVHQEYHTPGYKRINTLLGCTYLVQNKPSEISIRKQAISIAPNMVHSFDAAHMMLTIERAALRDIVDFAVVHDSFGCHAAYMDEFVGLIREEFVKIYRQDWFARLQADFQRSAGHGVPLIAPPERGDFNIDEVLGAEFFFA